nr:LacI family DNA-binding transcriptional regulator [Kribbella qitaiheensis]
MSRPGKRTTIVDIAQRAQVSISTVSRVLNGQTISDQLLAGRVREAAAELGYRPNVVARDFRRGVTSTIGVVVPDLANPFFPHVLKGLAEDVSAGDHRLLVVDSGENPEQELRLVTQLAGTCDGIILCSPRMPVSDLGQISALGVPVVCTNRSVGKLPFGTVGIDSAAGMRQAIAHLHDLGHRKIGYLGGPATSWSDGLRREGLRAAAAEYGVEVVSVAGRFDERRRVRATARASRGKSHRRDRVQRHRRDRRARPAAGAVDRRAVPAVGDRVRRHPGRRVPRAAADHRHAPEGGARPPRVGPPARSDAVRRHHSRATPTGDPHHTLLHRRPLELPVTDVKDAR